MPRGLRVDGPGFFQHVTFRGVEGRVIFLDDEDRRNLLRRLIRLIPELGFSCFAWVFMNNHVHLVLQTGTIELAKLMARIGTGYALSFNRRHGRVGHLWQGRYWSRPLDEDLETVVAYVHANPVRAGLVREEELARYPWCGHGWRVGARRAHAFERSIERSALPGRGIAAELGLARGDRATSVHERLDWVVEAICAQRCVSAERVKSLSRSRDLAAARIEIARVAVIGLRIPGRAVAEALGVSGASVSRWLQQRAEASAS